MEIILKKNVKGLGQKHDLLQVKPGYGRNYLIPQGYAELATPSLKKLWQENQKQSEHKRARLLADAEQLAEKLKALTVEIATKASEKGNIYGAVTSTQVADALKANGHLIPRNKIYFKTHIKTLGSHQATIDLHKKVQQDINLLVVEERESSSSKK